MDATDNLYVLIKGRKTFKLLSPDYAPLLHTVGPTYGVSSNGFSYQMNPAELADLLLNYTDTLDFSVEELDYGVDEMGAKNYHFSMASNTDSPVGSIDNICDVSQIGKRLMIVCVVVAGRSCW